MTDQILTNMNGDPPPTLQYVADIRDVAKQ